MAKPATNKALPKSSKNAQKYDANDLSLSFENSDQDSSLNEQARKIAELKLKIAKKKKADTKLDESDGITEKKISSSSESSSSEEKGTNLGN